MRLTRRIVDPKFYDAVRARDGVCLWGMKAQDCEGRLEVHHIIPRGRGGDDVLSNGITLCQKHHQMAHKHQITIEQLQETLTFWTNPMSD